MNTTTYHFGLTGYPLEHSLSPRIHTAALRASNLPGEYKLYPVPPSSQGQSELAALLDRIRTGELQGLNVTIPHKQLILSLLDGLTPAADAIGAVNTVYLDDEKLIGENTDAPGFTADLGRFFEEIIQEWQYTIPLSKAGLVLGAGGAARAVVYTLVRDGWRVCVAARRTEQARELLRGIADARGNQDTYGSLTPIQLEAGTIRRLAGDIALIVNATPLGMAPQVYASAWPSGVPFPPGALVYDLVYNPHETALVRAARAAGLPARTGLGMLIEQAALAFERWTGITAPRQAMWESVHEE